MFKKALIFGLGLVSFFLGFMILSQCCMGFDGGGLSPLAFCLLLITGLLSWAGLFYLLINGYRLAGVSQDHWRYGRTMSSRDALSVNQTSQDEPSAWKSLLKELIPVFAVVLGLFVFGIILRGYKASHPIPFDLIGQEDATTQMTLLLKTNPDLLNERNDAGETLLTAGVLAGQTAMIEVLLSFGIDAEQKNKDGKTALMLAAGQPEVVAMLLENGADPDQSDPFGWAALHYAVWQRSEESVKLLLENEASVNMRDREGRTALTLALESGFMAIQQLLSHGAAIASFNSNGETPLHVAARNNRSDAIRLLLRYGADTSAFSRLGWTPLHVAALHNAVDAAEVLLESGADVDQLNKRKQSPMHCAVRNNQEDMIALFLAHGSAVDPAEAARVIQSRPMKFDDYQSRIRLNQVETDESVLTIKAEEVRQPELSKTTRREELQDMLNLQVE